jgi:hypothetical protein
MFTSRSLRTFIWEVACLGLSVEYAHANLMSNGSFEQGVFVDQGNQTMRIGGAAGNDFAIFGGWSAGSTVAWIDTGNPYGLSAENGNRFLNLANFTTIQPSQQGLEGWVVTFPGHQYELSFFLGSYTQRWGGPPVSITVSVAGNKSRTFTVPTTSTSSTWTQFSMIFDGVGFPGYYNSQEMRFIPEPGGPAYIGLDNVDVEETNLPVVPEPKSYTLLIAGLAMIAAARFGHR